ATKHTTSTRMEHPATYFVPRGRRAPLQRCAGFPGRTSSDCVDTCVEPFVSRHTYRHDDGHRGFHWTKSCDGLPSRHVGTQAARGDTMRWLLIILSVGTGCTSSNPAIDGCADGATPSDSAMDAPPVDAPAETAS